MDRSCYVGTSLDSPWGHVERHIGEVARELKAHGLPQRFDPEALGKIIAADTLVRTYLSRAKRLARRDGYTLEETHFDPSWGWYLIVDANKVDVQAATEEWNTLVAECERAMSFALIVALMSYAPFMLSAVPG